MCSPGTLVPNVGDEHMLQSPGHFIGQLFSQGCVPLLFIAHVAESTLLMLVHVSTYDW